MITVPSRAGTIALLGLALFLSPASRAAAASFNLTRVVDQDTAIPNGTGTFSALNSFSLSGSNVAFLGGSNASGQQGIYFYDGGLSRVADLDTAVPNGTGDFTVLSLIGLSGSRVGFVGFGSPQHGIYFSDGGSLSIAADTSTAIPGGTGAFGAFYYAQLRDGSIGFRGESLPSQQGLYLHTDGGLARVADLGTPIPNGTGDFTDFSLGPIPGLSGGSMAFYAAGNPAQAGIYLFDGSTLSRVADLTTPIPNGTGTFAGFGGTSVLMSGTNVVFYAVGSSGQQGIYLFNGGSISRVADANTPIPGGTGNFTSFIAPALSGGTVAFIGQGGSGQIGIYLFSGGTLTRIVDKTTAIPNGMGAFTSISGMALSGSNVAFYGQGVNSQQGIYFSDGTDISVVADQNTAIPNGTGSFGVFAFTPAIDGQTVAFFGASGLYLASSTASTTTTLTTETTTTTSAESTTTTTTMPGGCQALGGVPGLQCVCSAGIAVAPCSGQRVPSSVGKGFLAACAAIDKLAVTPAGKAAKKLAKKAAGKFDRIERTAMSKRTMHKISAACETALSGLLADARIRADTLRAIR